MLQVKDGEPALTSNGLAKYLEKKMQNLETWGFLVKIWVIFCFLEPDFDSIFVTFFLSTCTLKSRESNMYKIGLANRRELTVQCQ